ncbi:MAG: hypothetical protein AAF899_17675, partial [Pseudomonadota bacterium]
RRMHAEQMVMHISTWLMSVVFGSAMAILPGLDGTGSALAQDSGAERAEVSTEPFNLATLSCWEVMTLPEDESAFVMAMLIGYAKGQQSAPTATPLEIVETVEGLDAACADNPDQPALDVLK